MAKEIYRGKEGIWRTLPNGVHIFIPDGSDMETEINKLSDDTWNAEYTKSQYANEILKHFSYADFKYWYQDKETHERIKPAKHAKRVLRNCLEHREIIDPAMDELLIKTLENKVNELVVNDRGTNWFRGGATRRIQIDIDGNDKNKILEALSHEIGHALDNDIKSGFLSSSFKSPTLDTTMSQSLFHEMTQNLDLETINDEADIFADLMRQVREQYQNSQIDETEYKRAYFRYYESTVCLADMCQAIYGDKACEGIFGYTPHKRGYFKDNSENAATECFAELTSDLWWDKEKRFYNLMKQYCPDTVKIYHEIIEEVKNQWK